MGRKDSRSSSESRGKTDKKSSRPQRKKVCHFCKEKITYIDYKDLTLMRKFVSDRGKIRARRVTGTCVQHQHEVATAVKNAREMALLPYVMR
ncbi:MAG: 30S ribosomal protein S18 [Actinobacteria bacterium]|nr:30S ribosomal protein S18 [Actinomycetota bacterium]